MRRSRRTVTNKRPLIEESSDEDEPLRKKPSPPPKGPKDNKKASKTNGSSSSESDIESYLQPIDKIDLNSPFFSPQEKPQFDEIESKIFSGVTRCLSDSDSDDFEDVPTKNATRVNFEQLNEYTRKLEEAKVHVEKYNANKKRETKPTKTENENNLNVSDLLAAGEKLNLNQKQSKELYDTLHSSDFESLSSDTEKGDWEEVKSQEVEEKQTYNELPKEGLQITIDLPGTMRNKKKKDDILSALKRRLNRIRKENQLYIHKVHLLCWIAHGNFVNCTINHQKILGMALSLLPSEKCYPPERTDLGYLEQILLWFKKTVKLVEKVTPISVPLKSALQIQIAKKEANNKKTLVYIFIAILRSLGIQCRLVLSFKVEPLRPPASELHSLSTKDTKEKNSTTSKASSSKNSPNSSKNSSKYFENTGKKCGEASTSKGSKLEGKLNKSVEQKGENSSPDSKRSLSLKSEKRSTRTKGSVSRESGKNSPTETEKPAKTSRKTRGKSPQGKTEEKPVTKRTKAAGKRASKSPKTSQENLQVKDEPKKRYTRSSSKSPAPEATASSKVKAAPKTIKVKPPARTTRKTIAQVDGTYTSESDDDLLLFIPQLDGATKDQQTKKPNLLKLKQTPPVDCEKNHPKRLNTSNESLKKLRELAPLSVKTGSPSKTGSKYFQNDVVKIVKTHLVAEKRKARLRKVKNNRKNLSESDSDYLSEPVIKKKQHDSEDDFVPKVKVKRRVQVKPPPDRTVLSEESCDESGGKNKKRGVDVWCEVFLESEEKWISVDVVKGQVHCVKELHARATHPVSYVVAWNNDNSIKDVTKRYCVNFNTVTRKLRTDANWWERSLKPFEGTKTARDKEEDDELARQQLEKPLPTVIGEYKNHPLYVLQRHLLKFEGIYPPDAPTLGFVRKEPVYSRDCVYTLHSRDIWLKHAKVVKPGEKPYKIVKARPKYDKLSNTMITDQMLEIFGPWQTQDYEPPTAENGLVPRNAFGNVELFKACMLPKKTRHLQLPGLNKIAKRMNIDCASAVVGFDFHSGWSHPTYDGFVVCEEFADELIAAWEVEQEEIVKREEEKVEKRVYGNWRRLIKGLLIRERLKKRYAFGVPSTSEESKGTKKMALKAKVACSNKKQPSDSESD